MRGGGGGEGESECEREGEKGSKGWLERETERDRQRETDREVEEERGVGGWVGGGADEIQRFRLVYYVQTESVLFLIYKQNIGSC